MGILTYATGNFVRLPKLLGLPARDGMIQVSSGQLEAVLQQVEDVSRKAHDLVAGRTTAHLTTGLGSVSWSVTQCLDHLARTTNAVLPAISMAIARAPRLTTNRALRTGALTRVLLRNLEPPYRLRFSVHSSVVPRQDNFRLAWGAFEDSQNQLAWTIRCAAGLALDRVIVKSPVYARLRYNVYGALRMLAAHERRHLWQMEGILKNLDDATEHDVPGRSS